MNFKIQQLNFLIRNIFLYFSLIPITFAAEQNCTNWKKNDWLKFRDSYIEYFTAIPVEKIISAYIKNPDKYPLEFQKFFDPHLTTFHKKSASTVKRCVQSLDQLGLKNCFSRFQEYVLAQEQLAGPFAAIGPKKRDPKDPQDYGYATQLTEENYLKSLPKEIFEFPEEFHSLQPDPWKQAAVQKKIPYVEFISQLDGEHRFIFLEKLENFDRYSLLMPDRKSIDVILIENTTMNPKLYFVELTKNFPGFNGKAKVHNNMQPCLRCHVNGPRIINPQQGTLKTSFIPGLDPSSDNAVSAIAPQELAKVRLQALNDNIAKHGLPDWLPFNNFAKFGPGLDQNRVRSCGECHNGIDRNEINDAFYRYEIVRKIFDEKSMPPKHPDLHADSRKELLIELYQNHFSNLKQWLKEPSCE